MASHGSQMSNVVCQIKGQWLRS